MQKSFMPDNLKILNGSVLKIIAVISMFIDHFALLLAPQIPLLTAELFSIGTKTITLYYIMRRIGRLAFPIFCFLVTVGFRHTKSRKHYALRLLIFAAISEIPYNLMKSGHLFYPGSQNVFFTLFLGVIFLYIYEADYSELLKLSLMILLGAATIILKPDYSLGGALIILLIYVLKEKPVVQMVLSYPLLLGGVFAVSAFIPINMYNGKRGFINSPVLKYCFYLFYPVHILALVIIKLILMN